MVWREWSHTWLKPLLAHDSRLKIPGLWFTFIDSTSYSFQKLYRQLYLTVQLDRGWEKCVNEVDMQFVGNKPPWVVTQHQRKTKSATFRPWFLKSITSIWTPDYWTSQSKTMFKEVWFTIRAVGYDLLKSHVKIHSTRVFLNYWVATRHLVSREFFPPRLKPIFSIVS